MNMNGSQLLGVATIPDIVIVRELAAASSVDMSGVDHLATSGRSIDAI
jgi:hypothetical protein